MSTSNDDMQPITRKELREELAASDAKLDAKLSTFAGAIFAAMRAMQNELKQQIVEAVTASERRLMTELGAHTRASTEDLASRVSIVDEKYQDLPARVARLEAITPAPRRRARKS